MGQLFVSDSNQPMRVIFDTGSDYLAVTSDLCSDSKFGNKFRNAVSNSMDKLAKESIQAADNGHDKEMLQFGGKQQSSDNLL